MQCSWSFCYAEFRSALLPSICQLAADDNAFPWFVPSLTLSSPLSLLPLRLSAFISLAQPLPPPPLSISFPFSSIPRTLFQPPPPSSSSVHPFVLLLSFPRLFHPLSWPSLFHARALFAFAFMIVHRAQLRNGFIIELPSAMNLSLFWRNTPGTRSLAAEKGGGGGEKINSPERVYILRILDVRDWKLWRRMRKFFRWEKNRCYYLLLFSFFFFLVRSMSNTMSKLIREKMYYCFIYRRAFFLSFFFFKFNTLSINFTISKLSFHSIFGFKYELLSLFNIWKNTIIPVTIRWQCWLYLFAWLYYGKFKINIKLHGTNVITFLPLHFFLRSNYTHLYSILIPLGSSIYILRQSLTPLFHFRERFPFIKSTGTLDEETGRTGLKRKDWQLSKYRRWQTRSFLKTFDSNNKFSSDKTNAARSNYSQDVEYLFQKRPLSFFLFFFLSSSHPLSASTLLSNLL